MKPEARITASIINRLKRMKRDGFAVWWLKIAGGAFQRSGTPDLVVVLDGRTIWCEIKDPRQGRLSVLQRHVLRTLDAAGAEAHVVTSLPQFEDLLCLDLVPKPEKDG